MGEKRIWFGLLLVIFAFTSCKKEGCTDVTATNYMEKAKVNDGTCTYERDPFIGTYEVSETCTYKENNPYTIKVLEGPVTNEVIFENLYNEGERVRAIIANNEADFKQDVVGITYEGSAYMLGSELNINYNVCETYYYPCSDVEACAIIGTKK